jgi:YD repeat-containing protein
MKTANRAVHAAVALLSGWAGVASAQVTIPEEYRKTIDAASNRGALSADALGEEVSLYTGATSFRAVDVQLAGGHRLPVEVGRIYSVDARSSVEQELLQRDGTFGDWDLDIPKIHGVFSRRHGWQINGQTVAASLKRCTGSINASAAPRIAEGDQGGLFDAAEYWHGHKLRVPGQGDRELLQVNTSVNPHLPASGGPFAFVTNDQWVVSCLPGTANGAAGEAFLAKSPDGTEYRFDWMVTRFAPWVRKPYSAPLDASSSPGSANAGQTTQSTQSRDSADVSPMIIAQDTAILSRVEVMFYPTRVTDRFGNYVEYAYDSERPARLTSVVGSDGRRIQLYYDSNGRVDSIIADGRTWQYVYGSGLAQVVLPDGSFWKLDMSGTHQMTVAPSYNTRLCEERASSTNQKTYRAFLTHPSGLTGEFHFRSNLHGRSYVPRLCIRSSSDDLRDFAWTPKSFDVTGLIYKRLSGPALIPIEAHYSYESSSGYWSDGCASGCPDTKWVEVRSVGELRRYTFGTRFGFNEGKVLKEEKATAAGDVLQSKVVVYATSDVPGAGFPRRAGDSSYTRGGMMGEKFSPILSRVIEQDGVRFEEKVASFDHHARPLRLQRSNSMGYSVTDTLEYFDDPGRWVLGQIRRRTTAGIETERTEFDAVALPWRVFRFGALEQELVYQADGQLAQVSDGRRLSTTFSSYRRGIPQLVRFADSTSQSASVDERGLITSVTDAAGSTTCYGYDEMGRVNLTVPTSESQAGVCDESAWNATHSRFEPVWHDEHGLPAGHWRLTENTGNARTSTYFDAMWRPVVKEAVDVADAQRTTSWVAMHYDEHGRVAFQSYPRNPYESGAISWAAANQGVRTTYDVLGRPIRLTQDSELGPLATTIEYAPGFIRKTTDPKGGVTFERFQAFDQPTYDRPVQIDAPEATRTTIVRDVFGKPKSITRGASN